MQILFLILAGVAGIIIGRKLAVFMRMRGRKNGKGLSVQEMIQEKEAAKRMIMGVMREKKRLTNDEVEEVLRVSDATATRYFDELEKEGKIVQKGGGRSTYYELK